MIDRRYLERAGNVVMEDHSGVEEPKARGDEVRSHGSQLWGQISHPGRQCPRLVTLKPLTPSEVKLSVAGNFGKRRAMTETDIRTDSVERLVMNCHAALEHVLRPFVTNALD